VGLRIDNQHFQGEFTRFSDLAEEDHLPERYE
jgi:replicative DNA helicase